MQWFNLFCDIRLHHLGWRSKIEVWGFASVTLIWFSVFTTLHKKIRVTDAKPQTSNFDLQPRWRSLKSFKVLAWWLASPCKELWIIFMGCLVDHVDWDVRFLFNWQDIFLLLWHFETLPGWFDKLDKMHNSASLVPENHNLTLIFWKYILKMI